MCSEIISDFPLLIIMLHCGFLFYRNSANANPQDMATAFTGISTEVTTRTHFPYAYMYMYFKCTCTCTCIFIDTACTCTVYIH